MANKNHLNRGRKVSLKQNIRHFYNYVNKRTKRTEKLGQKRHQVMKLVHSFYDEVLLKPTSVPEPPKKERVKSKSTRQTSEEKNVKLYNKPGSAVYSGKFTHPGHCSYDVIHQRPDRFHTVTKNRYKFLTHSGTHIQKFWHQDPKDKSSQILEKVISEKESDGGIFDDSEESWNNIKEGSGGDVFNGEDDNEEIDGESQNELNHNFGNSNRKSTSKIKLDSHKVEKDILDKDDGIFSPTFFPLRQEFETKPETSTDWFLENFPRTSMFSLLEGSSQTILWQTTPKLGVTDDIIFSGAGAGCHSDDEDDCTSVGSGLDDDIITPTVIINTTPQPPTTTTPRPRKRPIICSGPDCRSRDKSTDDIFGPTPDYPYNPAGIGGATPFYPLQSSFPPKGDNSKESVGGVATLNIGLIVGIAAGVLVALLILIFALYKFRSRDEGTYKVDESQNFSYLESKKPQGNGALLGANDSNKRGKKKDVKEWYV